MKKKIIRGEPMIKEMFRRFLTLFTKGEKKKRRVKPRTKRLAKKKYREKKERDKVKALTAKKKKGKTKPKTKKEIKKILAVELLKKLVKKVKTQFSKRKDIKKPKRTTKKVAKKKNAGKRKPAKKKEAKPEKNVIKKLIKKKVISKIAVKKPKEKKTIKKPTKSKRIRLKRERKATKRLPAERRKGKAEPKTKKIIKKTSFLTLVKSAENPIILPKAENKWEAWQTFNPGVILLDNKVHFLYRAVGSDGLSRLGYAVSSDGFNIDERLPYPVYEHQPKQHQFTVYSYFSGGSWGGCEDPRIVRVDKEDTLYMTYTACDGGLRVGLTSIKIDDFLGKRWNWKTPKLISSPGEVHKNWVIFPEKIKGKYAILHSINPKISVDYVDDLEFNDLKYIQSQHGGRPAKTLKCWDNWIRGAGPAPLKTQEGWLVLYHAMDDRDPDKYKVGAMLLDLDDPTKVLHRSPEPILEPCELYENNGFKSGVVYASGAIVKDGKLLVYYGGADSCVCVAYTDFKEFVEALRRGTKPKLRKKKLKTFKKRGNKRWKK